MKDKFQFHNPTSNEIKEDSAQKEKRPVILFILMILNSFNQILELRHQYNLKVNLFKETLGVSASSQPTNRFDQRDKAC